MKSLSLVALFSLLFTSALADMSVPHAHGLVARDGVHHDDHGALIRRTHKPRAVTKRQNNNGASLSSLPVRSSDADTQSPDLAHRWCVVGLLDSSHDIDGLTRPIFAYGLFCCRWEILGLWWWSSFRCACFLLTPPRPHLSHLTLLLSLAVPRPPPPLLFSGHT